MVRIFYAVLLFVLVATVWAAGSEPVNRVAAPYSVTFKLKLDAASQSGNRTLPAKWKKLRVRVATGVFTVEMPGHGEEVRSSTASSLVMDRVSREVRGKVMQSDLGYFVKAGATNKPRGCQLKRKTHVRFGRGVRQPVLEFECDKPRVFQGSVAGKYLQRYQSGYDVQLYLSVKKKLYSLIQKVSGSARERKRIRHILASFQKGQLIHWLTDSATCRGEYSRARMEYIETGVHISRLLFQIKPGRIAFSQCQVLTFRPLRLLKKATSHKLVVYVGKDAKIKVVSIQPAMSDLF